MDSGVVTKVSGRVVEFFQFHCMDSSSTMLNSHQSSTYHPFNSIVWIQTPATTVVVDAVTSVLSIPLYGFFSHTTVYAIITKKMLSIPLYGFGGSSIKGSLRV